MAAVEDRFFFVGWSASLASAFRGCEIYFGLGRVARRDKFITLSYGRHTKKVQKVMTLTTVVKSSRSSPITFLLSSWVEQQGQLLAVSSVSTSREILMRMESSYGEKVEFALIISSVNIRCLLVGWKFDEAGALGVGLLHHGKEVARILLNL